MITIVVEFVNETVLGVIIAPVVDCNSTVAPLTKLVPVIVTSVAVLSIVEGDTLVTVGALAGPAADLTPTFEIPPGYVPGPEMDNFTQVETDEKYSFLVPRVTYGGCSMLNKVIYDPHHTHIGLVRPGSAPAGTRPPTHIKVLG